MAFRLRAGDQRPHLDVTLTDGGAALDLTAALSVTLVARKTDDITEVWRNAATVDPDQVNHKGHVSYAWRAADTATPGEYRLSFLVEWSSGEAQTLPSTGGIDFIVASGASPVPYELLVVDPEKVARRLRLPLPLDEVAEAAIIEAILASQATVEAYWGRPVVPTTYTESLNGFWPSGGYSGNLLSSAPLESWPVSNDPLISVSTTVDDPNNPGYTLVTYVAGYDCRNDPRHAVTREYVTASAVQVYRRDNPASRNAKSVTVEGQTITYDDPPKPGEAGSPPRLTQLSRWRKRRVYSRPRLLPSSGYASGQYGGGLYGVVDSSGLIAGGDARSFG